MAREEFVITARDETKAAFRSVSAGIGKMNAALGAVGLGALGLGAVVTVLRSAAAEAQEAEREVNKLNAVFRATGGAVGLTRAELDGLAQTIGRTTQYEGEQVTRAISGLMTFKNVQGETFKQAISLSADLAVLMGTDLSSASRAVGRALESPTQGLNALRRAGIVFSESQREMIEKMVESGNTAGAQELILKQLQERIGGVSEAENKGLTGSVRRLDKAWKDLMETIGGTRIVQGGGGIISNSFAFMLDQINEKLRESDALLNAITPKKQRYIGGDLGTGKPIVDPNMTPEEAMAKMEAVRAANEQRDAVEAEFEAKRAEKRKKDLEEALKRQNEETLIFVNGINARGAALMTDRERINLEYEQRLLDLENHYVLTEMSEQTHADRLAEITQEKNDRLRQIDERHMSAQEKLWASGMKGRLQVTGQIFGALSDLMQAKSKRMFEVGKAAAIAQTLIDTYTGAQKAFTALASFPPAAYAAAAAATAAGLVRVQNIRAQQFQGGGGGGGATGTYSASPNTGLPTQQPGLPQTQNESRGNTVQIIIEGNVIGNDEYVNGTLIPAIANAVNNNDVVLINSNSRNAREITGA